MSAVPDTLSAARMAIRSAARALVGLTQTDLAYQVLVDPGGTPEHRIQTAAESGCMLVRLGLEDTVFRMPDRDSYIPGSAPTLLEDRAAGDPWHPEHGWVIPSLSAPPRVGDGIYYGESGALPEHCDCCILSVDGTDPFIVTVVAGGQRTGAGLECVAQLTRTLEWGSERWIDRATGRPVIGVLDCDYYAGHYGLKGCGV